MQRPLLAGMVMLMLLPLIMNAKSDQEKKASPASTLTVKTLPKTATPADTGRPVEKAEKFEFQNAYSIANDLMKQYRARDTEKIIQTLAALAWYTGINQPEDLRKKIEAPGEYNLLRKKTSALFDSIIDIDKIFLWSKVEFNANYTETDQAKKSLLEAMEKVWDKSRMYEEKTRK